MSMTCFWTSIIKTLDADDLTKLGLNKKPNVNQLIETLKNVNKKDISVHWNDIPLTDKQKEENFDHIKDYDSKSSRNGYLCGVCDPFLILLCEILEINIKHTFLNNTIHYKSGGEKTYKFGNNRRHFYNIK